MTTSRPQARAACAMGRKCDTKAQSSGTKYSIFGIAGAPPNPFRVSIVIIDWEEQGHPRMHHQQTVMAPPSLRAADDRDSVQPDCRGIGRSELSPGSDRLSRADGFRTEESDSKLGRDQVPAKHPWARQTPPSPRGRKTPYIEPTS